MKISVYFTAPVGILKDVYDSIDTDHEGVVDIDTNDAGVQIEGEDAYFFIPWHSVSGMRVDKDN